MHKISGRELIRTGAVLGGGIAVSKDIFAQRPDEPARTSGTRSWNAAVVGAPLIRDPVWVYDNWAAYGIGEANSISLTEALALRLLDEVVRYRRLGVRFDYYMMNGFWFEPAGGYRQWRKDAWPDGPDRWIERCLEHGIKPGLWFGTNYLWELAGSIPQWRESIAVKQGDWPTLSMYEGGFLPDFLQVLQHWYDRGIRMFEFDVADFDAATPAALKNQSGEEIRRRNQSALREGLRNFRRHNPDVMLVAFNGFGADQLDFHAVSWESSRTL